MKYISIDGDDVGRKVTSCYLNNDSERLRSVIGDVDNATKSIAELLSSNGFEIIFCAADGVVAYTDSMPKESFSDLFERINNLSPDGLSFSAGVGDNLHEAYIALLAAKSNGKNCLYNYSDVLYILDF